MAHKTIKTSYDHLINRLNKFPQGVTPSELLYKILKMLFDEKEAELVARNIKEFFKTNYSQGRSHRSIFLVSF